MSQRKKSGRSRRRGSDGPMPMSGAGLIRFFQDSSQGIKVTPMWTVVLSVLLIVSVILAHVGVFSWIFGV